MKFKNRLDAVLQEIFERWGMPGMAVGIVEGDEIVYTKALGVQSRETRAPVTTDSIFCIASIAKCFTASAVMQLVEKGRIQLETPLVRYLPYFRLDDERFSKITIRQVLSHTSGLPDIDEFEYNDLVSHPEIDDGALERCVRGLINRKLAYPPGERFYYSNIGYSVLGDLIAKVSGQTFEEYVKVNILRPAGMTDSTFLLAEVDRERLAVPHLRTPELIVNPIYPYHRGDAPGSFMHSTVVDMCHWASTSLHRGVYNGKRILMPASYDLMWTPVARRGSPPFREEVGLGWYRGHFEGVNTVCHGGGGFGWTCFLVLLPEKNRAAIILCNEESSAHRRAVEAAVRTMLDQEPQAGTVSWVVPICKAYQAGGFDAAASRYTELKAENNGEYFYQEYEMITLVFQLMGVGKIDVAIDMLNLNIHAFPEDLESYTRLADLYMRKGEHSLAEKVLEKASAIHPDSAEVAELLAKIRKN